MSTAAEQWPRRHLINVDEYYRMAEVGLFARDARVELIEGVIIDMAPIGSLHASIVNALTRRLVTAAGDQAVVCIQQPIRLSGRSEPQPDVAVLKPRPDLYRSGHPTSSDVLLVIEVSDSTLEFDLNEKCALYARHGIVEYWVIDAQAKKLHCMRELSGNVYRSVSVLDSAQKVAITALPNIEIGLDLIG
jgi:Uma2 family endonuclease